VKALQKIFLFVSLLAFSTSCREPFIPNFKTGINDYLVVEGFINIGVKSVTSITLSRVGSLSSSRPISENGATVVIESANGFHFPLYEIENGKYVSDSLDLDPLIKYRMLITSHNGNQYSSSFSEPKISPVIDSLTWRWEADGINVYVNSHDSENNTQYYKWDYQETWEINSDYVSRYTYENGMLNVRNVIEKDNMFYCWKYASAKDLHFASTTQLESDWVQYQIVSLPHYSDRTSVRYSILVEQRALSKEEFDYLQIIQKNSSVTGSLFDPLPGEIKGNLKSISNPDEPVIGYIGAYSQQTKRLFIRASELNADPNPKCETILVVKDFNDSFYGSEGFYTPITIINLDSSNGAAKYCMDCRLRGGDPKEPDFW
jgi:hypothetical protein